MKLSTSIALAGLGIHSSIASPVPEGQATNDCNNYVLLSSRGTGEPQGPSVGFVGMIKATFAAVPGGAEHDVVYPAASDATQKSTFIGAKDIEDFINNGLKSCPQQKYALLGYSQGATVTLEALGNLAGTPADKAIKAVVLIGDPYQVKNLPSTVDENGGSSTRGNNGILLPLAPSVPVDPSALPKDGRALNICYTGDPVCNGVADAFTSPAHLIYGFSPPVQKLGSDHLISKLK